MKENNELALKPNTKKLAIEKLLPFLEAFPQVVQPGIGLEAFVEDLHKASMRFGEYFIRQD